MSEEIKFDPSIHMLKVEAEQVISSRISKFSEKLNTANESLSSLQGRYDEAANRLAMVDTLQEQVNSLQSNLTTERSQFSRQNHLTQKGIGSDLSIRSGFENQFEQHIAGITEGDKPDFNSWLDGITQNPETAPALFKRHKRHKRHRHNRRQAKPHRRHRYHRQTQTPEWSRHTDIAKSKFINGRKLQKVGLCTESRSPEIMVG